MNRLKTYALAAICLLLTIGTYAQDTSKDAVLKAVTDYFALERENIHIQCNKNIFTTNEQIWFKGYVFHRKNNVPFFNTVNVFASLIDEGGNILQTQLIYANIGSFAGSFKLNNTFKSGRYYLQFYTNWMNNFSEDESSVYEVAVINPATGAGNALAKADTSKINIEINPEGGTLVSGMANIAGLHISDCNHEPLAISTADIIDASGKLVKQVQINKQGYGRFEITPKAGEIYKAIITLNEAKHEQTFTAVATGMTVEVNSYALPDKLMVSIRTPNAAVYSGKPLHMLIQKDEKASIFDLTFDDKGELKMVINKAEIFDGLNTLRILDANLTEIAQRLFYNYPKDKLNLEVKPATKNVNEAQFAASTGYPNMNLSIAILPDGTQSYDNANDIYGSLLLLPYINTRQKPNGHYYFSTLSKGKMYELDLYLMSQKSKYAWNNILTTPPKDNNPFDMGITVKGTLPNPSADDKYAQVRLYAITSGIDERVKLDEKSSFTFDRLIMLDSTHVSFTLLRNGKPPKDLRIAPQLLYASRKFNKPYKPEPRCFAIPETVTTPAALPNFYNNATELNEIKIDATRLTHAKNFGNGNLTGYKITPDKEVYQSLIRFIATYSTFEVRDNNGEVTIYSRMKTSINGARTGPIVYIDNVQQLDYNILSIIQMNEVDEVYIGAHTIIPSIRNYMGAIKIYLKKGVNSKMKNTTPDILIPGGFERTLPFENIQYSNTTDEGFITYGVIDWQPQIMTDDAGAFKLRIPVTGQKTVKVYLEGFSADGKLISEVKTINLQ